MRYFGGGIGHQNQDARWTSHGEVGRKNDAMDIDPDPEDDITQTRDTRLQELRQLALETSARPADSDDSDVDSSNSDDSDNTSMEGDLSSDNDSDEGVDDYEPYFGPEDGDGDREDYGFSEF